MSEQRERSDKGSTLERTFARPNASGCVLSPRLQTLRFDVRPTYRLGRGVKGARRDRPSRLSPIAGDTGLKSVS